VLQSSFAGANEVDAGVLDQSRCDVGTLGKVHATAASRRYRVVGSLDRAGVVGHTVAECAERTHVRGRHGAYTCDGVVIDAHRAQLSCGTFGAIDRSGVDVPVAGAGIFRLGFGRRSLRPGLPIRAGRHGELPGDDAHGYEQHSAEAHQSSTAYRFQRPHVLWIAGEFG
jgi:hypothetical protein